MKKSSFLLFIIITIAMTSLFSLPDNVAAASKMPKGSMIANILLEGKTDQEVREILENEITIWKAGEPLHLTSDFEKMTIPREAFDFNVEETVNQFNEQTKRTLRTFFMRPKNIRIPLIVNINETDETIQTINNMTYMNQETIFTNLLDIASELQSEDVSIAYLEGEEIPLELIAEVELEIPVLSEAVINYAIDALDEYTIVPNEPFLLLQAVDFPVHLTYSTEEISFIGSALYPLFLQTNVEIIERYAQLTQPSYTEPGLDAFISEQENKDLIISNTNDVAYKITMEKRGKTLYAAIYSARPDITYQYNLENITEIEERTLYRYSKNLAPGEEHTIHEGRKGLKVEVSRSIYENNVYSKSEQISYDIYLPDPTIKVVSTSTEIREEDLIDHSVDEIEEDLNDLEQKLDDLDEISDFENGFTQFPIVDLDPNMPTISAQLQEIRELQQELQEKISHLEGETLVSSLEMEKYQNEVEARFIEITEQLEQLLEFFLNEEHSCL